LEDYEESETDSEDRPLATSLYRYPTCNTNKRNIDHPIM
jgi:hypothetical protein